MSDDQMLHVTRWHNGEKTYQPFTNGEMTRRSDAMMAIMGDLDIDACLFTSYHNVCYFSGFLYCQFGRRYGAVLSKDGVTTISAAIDGGQPWRRSTGDNVTYTDWRRDSYFTALKDLLKGVKRLGIEFDHVNLDLKVLLEDHFPNVELVDCAAAAMDLRTIKSAEEHVLIRKGAEMCRVGGRAVMEAVKAGVGREAAHSAIKEHAVATVNDLRAGNIKENNLPERLASDDRIPLSLEQLYDIIATGGENAGTARSQVDHFADIVSQWETKFPNAANYMPGSIL